MKSKNLTTALEGVALLLSSISRGFFSDGAIIHINKVLKALSENPDAVVVDMSRLNVVWPRYREYVDVEKGGYILVIISKPLIKRRAFVSTVIKQSGIEGSRFKVVVHDNEFDFSKAMNSRECRAVLYAGKLPLTIMAEIECYPETSERIESLESKSAILSAIARLASKLGYA